MFQLFLASIVRGFKYDHPRVIEGSCIDDRNIFLVIDF